MSSSLNHIFSIDNINRVYEDSVSQKNIKGIDRVDIDNFSRRKDEQLEIIRRKCLNGTFTFTPYL